MVIKYRKQTDQDKKNDLEFKRKRREYSRKYYASNVEKCRNRRKNWEKNNREHRREYEREYKKKLRLRYRLEILTRLCNGKTPRCIVCGYNDIRALQIDHIRGDNYKTKENKEGIQYLIRLRHMQDKELLSNYQCLCANCNVIKKEENNENVSRLDTIGEMVIKC